MAAAASVWHQRNVWRKGVNDMAEGVVIGFVMAAAAY